MAVAELYKSQCLCILEYHGRCKDILQTCVADVGKAVALGVVPAVPELGLPAEREVGVHLVLDHLAHLVIIMMLMMMVMMVMMMKG